MSVELASAYVTVIPTTKGIAAGLEKELVGPINAAAKKAGDDAGKTIKKSLDETGKSFTKFGIAGLAVAGVLGAGLFKAGEAASDLGESVNAVKVTFGSAADGILKLGEDAAKSVGLSNAAFNGLAVQFSAFATTIAGKGGDVVGTIQDLTGRAADFASVMNIDVKDAATLFQSGLAGETEPLRKYGLDLSAAAVNAYAAANGIGTLGSELTEAEKVTARYGLLMESTSKNQGDFANTSDSAANATRIAKAELENATASLGAAFTPAIALAASTVASLAQKFTSLNDATGGWLAKAAGIGVLALGVASGISLVVGQVIKFRTALETMKGAFVTAEGGLTRTGAAAKALVGPLALVGVVATGLYLRSQHAADGLDAITRAAGELSRASDADALNTLIASIGVGIANGIGLDDVMKQLAQTNLEGAKRALELAKANGTSQEYIVALRRAIVDEIAAEKQAVQTTEEFGTSTDDLAGSTEDLTGETEDLAAAQKVGETVLAGVAKATEVAKEKADAFAESLKTQQDRLEDLYGIEYDAVQSKYDYADAQSEALLATDAFNTILKDHKATQDEVNTAQRAATDAIIDQSEKYATLDGAASGSQGAIARQIRSLEEQRDTLAPDSPLRQFLDQYITDLKNIPANVSTILALNIVADATNYGGGAPGYSTRDGKPHARGGPASGRILVGEEGPELLDVPAGSYVHTAQATRAMMSAASSLSAPTSTAVMERPIVYAPTIISPDHQVGKLFIDSVKQYERFNGDSWRTN